MSSVLINEVRDIRVGAVIEHVVVLGGGHNHIICSMQL
jgi:hypothetical protein